MGRTRPSDRDGGQVRAAQVIARPDRSVPKRPFGAGYPPIPARPEPSVPFLATAPNAPSTTQRSGASCRQNLLSPTTVGGSAAVDGGDGAVPSDNALIRHV